MCVGGGEWWTCVLVPVEARAQHWAFSSTSFLRQSPTDPAGLADQQAPMTCLFYSPALGLQTHTTMPGF